jgi:hypothetical protein
MTQPQRDALYGFAPGVTKTTRETGRGEPMLADLKSMGLLFHEEDPLLGIPVWGLTVEGMEKREVMGW